MAGCKRLHQYDVGGHVVGEHDEVVAATASDGHPAHVVSVELADWLYSDEHVKL